MSGEQTCFVGKKICMDLAKTDENVEKIDLKRYKLARKSKTYGNMKRKGYYTGDEIEYRCKKG